MLIKIKFNRLLGYIALFIVSCVFTVPRWQHISPVSLVCPIQSNVLRPVASSNAGVSGFTHDTEKEIAGILLSRRTPRLAQSEIEEYIEAIKKFTAPNFNYKIFLKKTLTLLNSEELIVREFAAKVFIEAGKLLAGYRKVSYDTGQVLGIAGEVSGVYELAYRPDTSLRNIRIGKIKAINAVITEWDESIIIKEFDALSENSVFEFKFHLNLEKLYEQVIGLQNTRISHFKVLSLPRFSYIRNLVYFGENEGGSTMKAALDFIEQYSLLDRITISATGSLSIKFDLREFQQFIFDSKTLEHAHKERPEMITSDFIHSDKAKNARKILMKKIAQIPEGEHFDVIIGISNPDTRDLVRARKLVNNFQAFDPAAHKTTFRSVLATRLIETSA